MNKIEINQCLQISDPTDICCKVDKTSSDEIILEIDNEYTLDNNILSKIKKFIFNNDKEKDIKYPLRDHLNINTEFVFDDITLSNYVCNSKILDMYKLYYDECINIADEIKDLDCIYWDIYCTDLDCNKSTCCGKQVCKSSNCKCLNMYHKKKEIITRIQKNNVFKSTKIEEAIKELIIDISYNKLYSKYQLMIENKNFIISNFKINISSEDNLNQLINYINFRNINCFCREEHHNEKLCIKLKNNTESKSCLFQGPYKLQMINKRTLSPPVILATVKIFGDLYFDGSMSYT